MVVQNALAYLKHTVAAGFSTFESSDDIPDSDRGLDLVMWRC